MRVFTSIINNKHKWGKYKGAYFELFRTASGQTPSTHTGDSESVDVKQIIMMTGDTPPSGSITNTALATDNFNMCGLIKLILS